MQKHIAPGEGLRLHVDTEGVAPAKAVGAMIERLAIAYEARLRVVVGPNMQRETLALAGLRIGSVWADLVTLGTVLTNVDDVRAVLAGFMTHMRETLLAMQTSTSGNVMPASSRRAIEAMAAPVAKGQAIQINLTLIGSNDNTIIIDKELATLLIEKQRETQSESRTRSFVDAGPRAYPEPVRRVPVRTGRGGPARQQATILRMGEDYFARVDGYRRLLIPVLSPPEWIILAPKWPTLQTWGDLVLDAEGVPVEFRPDDQPD